MNRLLAKLPLSSSGSRELSARSSAAALPADILEVSMTDCAAGFAGWAPDSPAPFFSGASSGDFIEFRAVPGVLAQEIARGELTTVAVASRYHFFDPEMVGEAQWAATQRREAGPEDHAVIRILGRGDDLFLEATRGFVDHQEDE